MKIGRKHGPLKAKGSGTRKINPKGWPTRLVDFTYNLGARNLGRSTLVSNINAGTDVTMKNFTDWNRAGGKVVPGLTIRRTDEYNLFSNGNYGGQ
jgi:GH24 family phage-related lysozyme (muramidase)